MLECMGGWKGRLLEALFRFYIPLYEKDEWLALMKQDLQCHIQ